MIENVKSKSHPKMFSLLYSVFAISILLIIVLGVVWYGRLVARPSAHGLVEHSMNRIQAIALAIQCVCEDHGGTLTFDNGFVSWRAQVLPYFEEGDLFRDIVQEGVVERQWDSEGSSRAREKVPYCFRNFNDRESKETAIVAIRTDRDFLWKCNSRLGRDNPDDNLFLIEIANSDINWLEPRDINVSELWDISSCHVVDGKKCVVIGMESGRSYLLTLENFRQIYPFLVDFSCGKKIIKKKNGRITTFFMEKSM